MYEQHFRISLYRYWHFKRVGAQCKPSCAQIPRLKRWLKGKFCSWEENAPHAGYILRNTMISPWVGQIHSVYSPILYANKGKICSTITWTCWWMSKFYHLKWPYLNTYWTAAITYPPGDCRRQLERERGHDCRLPHLALVGEPPAYFGRLQPAEGWWNEE